jgi:hypothetical protein
MSREDRLLVGLAVAGMGVWLYVIVQCTRLLGALLASV